MFVLDFKKVWVKKSHKEDPLLLDDRESDRFGLQVSDETGIIVFVANTISKKQCK